MPLVVPVARERAPRRARYLVPLATPRRAEVIAVLTLATLLAGALFAQVTLVAAMVFHAVTKVSRLRPWWLLAPAAAGVVWLLAGSPGAAAAGFGAAPAAVTELLRQSLTSPAALRHLAEMPTVIAPRLAGQLPLALFTGAAVAAFGWWLDWLHTDEWHLVPARPGLLSFAWRSWHTWSIRSGGVVTRDGVSLGVNTATGRPAALTWQQARSGVLVTGVAPDAVAASGLQIMHAAVRRRQPVVVVDLAGSPALHQAVAAICAACDAPLQVFGPQATATISVDEAVRHRLVALFPLGAAISMEDQRAATAVADLVTTDVVATYSGLPGALAPAGLVWVNGCEAVSPTALAMLASAGHHGPLAWVLGTTQASTAATWAARTGVCVVHRVADPGLVGQLAQLTGTRLAPAGHISADWAVPQADAGAVPTPVPAARPAGAGPSGASAVGVIPPGAGTGQEGGFGMIRESAVPAETLGTLGEGEFFLVARGGAVRARAVNAQVPGRPGEPPVKDNPR
jgi:hypothetical protein